MWQPKFLLIAGLYLAQGLPGGLMAYTLPTLLREQGVSLTVISLVSLLSFPWAFKLLWSKPLDQSAHRKRWFIASLFLASSCWWLMSMLTLSVWLKDMLYVFLALLLLANFVMASQDVLTDGLVVRLLGDDNRGLANAFQVVAYKLGMMISGALFLGFYDQIGWQQGMQYLIIVLAIAYVPFLVLSKYDAYKVHLQGASVSNNSDTYGDTALFAIIKDFVWLPGMLYWLAILACYKLGDGMISSLTKPFWFDLGLSKPVIAQASSIGIGLGVFAGVLAGFLWRYASQRNMDRRYILLVFALLQCCSIAGYWYLSQTHLNLSLWWTIVLFEQVVDVMSTVIIFTSMMAVCRKATAGIDYTFQATLLLVFSQSLHPISGLVADTFGYSTSF